MIGSVLSVVPLSYFYTIYFLETEKRNENFKKWKSGHNPLLLKALHWHLIIIRINTKTLSWSNNFARLAPNYYACFISLHIPFQILSHKHTNMYTSFFLFIHLLGNYILGWINDILWNIHPNSRRHNLRIKQKTWKWKDEIIYTWNTDEALNVVILWLPYFLEFKSISKIIHQVIYFGELLESEVEGMLMDGVG